MQVVKKGIKLIVSIAGLALFCACTKNVPVETITPTNGITVTVTPSVTEALQTPLPTTTPTAVITKIPTITATPTLTPTLTPLPEPTNTESPTKEPTNKPTKKPTATPTLLPTKTPTVTVGVTITDVPVVDLEPLITNGWQSMVDISQTVQVIFSECFNDSKVTKSETTLEICYTSTQEKELQFQVVYSMQQTLQHILDTIAEQGGIVLEETIQEKSVSYQIEQNNRIYQGIALEQDYQKELLGDVFGDADSIIGTMQVVFSYPKEQQMKYETEPFQYYVVKIP